jgi:hypothetical protein
MSLFGGKTNAATQTIASGVTIQSSVYGSVVPVLYGRTRMTGNLIWYGGFKAIAAASSNTGKGGGGSGGKNGSSSGTDYKASFAFALAEGPLGDVQTVWSSKSQYAFAASHLAFANGTEGQPPWGYLTTLFPGQDLAYADTGYVFAQAYDLGTSAQLPNLSYEVTGLFQNGIPGLPDADPMNVVVDVLTNGRYGIGFPANRLGDLSVFSNYCRAAGMVVSPLFDTQQDAATQVNQIVQDCNAAFVWSGATLTIVPYGDADLAANGASYTAPSAPLYSLTDDDFLEAGSDTDPVACSRARPSDRMNSVKLEWLNRGNQYNVEIVEAKDQAAIEAYGLRTAQPSQSHWFCNLAAATMSATLQLQRQAVRNQYSFTLGWKYCLLDPMDIVEISDAGLGIANQWVRILTLEEDDTGNIKVTAEDYLGGSGSAPLYSYASGSPFVADYNAAPGSINANPLIFEPPPAMLAANSTTAPQVMVGASGASNWGGADVWLSFDGSTYAHYLGRITGPARQGQLTAALAAGSDPDTTDTLAVSLAESGGQLLSGTAADLNAFRTLGLVDQELISYETATLTGTNAYNLTTLRRGVYGTAIAAHALGAQFCRLDTAIMSFDLPVAPVSYVGQTLYLKFLSFNTYGGGQELLADVPAYEYSPSGTATYVAPPSGVAFTVGAEQQKDGSWNSFGVVSWTASPDPVFDQYEVQYRLHAGPGPWISWRGGANTTSFRISPLPPNTAYDVQVRAVRSSGPFYSAWAQDLNVVTVGKTSAPPAPTSLNAVGTYQSVLVYWALSTENDIAGYEVWRSTDNVLAHAVEVTFVSAGSYNNTGLTGGATYYYWVRAIDTSGNYSGFAGPAEATTALIDNTSLVAGQQLVQLVSTISAADHTKSSVAIAEDTFKVYRWNGTAWITAVDGADITADTIEGNAIVADSLTAAQIAAGTITGDKMEANFIQGYSFEAGTTSGGLIQINGEVTTVSGVANGPDIRVYDDSSMLRVQAGRRSGAWGLWIFDSSGNVIFEEASLANGVVETVNVAANAITIPYSLNLASAFTVNSGPGTWQTIWTQGVTLEVTADTLFQFFILTAPIVEIDPPHAEQFATQILVDGSVVFTSQTNQAFFGTIVSIPSGSHTITIQASGWNCDYGQGTNVQILVCQR